MLLLLSLLLFFDIHSLDTWQTGEETQRTSKIVEFDHSAPYSSNSSLVCIWIRMYFKTATSARDLDSATHLNTYCVDSISRTFFYPTRVAVHSRSLYTLNFCRSLLYLSRCLFFNLFLQRWVHVDDTDDNGCVYELRDWRERNWMKSIFRSFCAYISTQQPNGTGKTCFTRHAFLCLHPQYNGMIVLDGFRRLLFAHAMRIV